MKRRYEVQLAGDMSAGIFPTSYSVELTIHEEEGGDELEEFIDEKMKQLLKDWYAQDGRCNVLDDHDLKRLESYDVE